MRFLIGSILTLISFVIGRSTPSFAQEFYYNQTEDISQEQSDIDLGGIVKEEITENNDSLLNQLLDIFGFGGSNYDGDDKAFTYVKGIVNLALSLASFIALIVVIYGFYGMFFSGHEEGFAKAKSTLKGALIALVLIGISRFLVSFFLSIFTTVTT